MKPFKINQNSWHFKLANWSSHENLATPWGAPTDFCQYSRMVMVAMCKALFIAILAMLLCIFPGSFLLWLGKMAWSLTLIPIPPVAGIFVAFVTVCLLMWGISRWIVYLQESMRRRAWRKIETKGDYPQPGFLTMWYRTTKNKFCIPVEIVNDE